MNSILQKPVILLDGGLGTTLEDEYGVTFSQQTPLWSSHLLVSDPDTLLQVQTKFVESGADIIITATYQASFEGFRKTSPGIQGKKAEKYMRSAVELARKAFSGRNGIVALSLGAYGACMIPSQEYTGAYESNMLAEESLLEWHQKRLQVFQRECWDQVDLLAFETLPRLSEIRAARLLMKQSNLRKPYWISCVFPKDNCLPDGSTVREIVKVMLEGDHPPFAIGINCTKLHRISDLVREFEETPESLPHLVLYPDGAGGLVYDTTVQKWVGDGTELSPWDERVFELVKEIQHRGKWKGILIGGCCKTRPDHIARLKRRLDQL